MPGSNVSERALWERFKRYHCQCESVGVSLDVSRMGFDDAFLDRMRPVMDRAFAEMAALEAGAIANPDEQRQVGHYWLRAPELAPASEGQAIRAAWSQLESFANRLGSRFKNLLVIGIGGSALGPQLVADALGGAGDARRPFFFDNTDPDGFDRVTAQLGPALSETLTIVISKSGGTKETRNGMLEAERAYAAHGLDLAKHAVAVTGAGSELDRHARSQGWLEIFPMWDWVGGRTSELSAVGLLPARLQGIDTRALLEGARLMDIETRRRDMLTNPAALMALMWHYASGGQGQKDLVVLPYKDRLLLLSRYLQQLVMESLGKERALDGRVVNQGLSVYGNKGSTDQHAYVQQLREGVPNFFVTFIEVLKDREGASLKVEDDVTSGDYLTGFLLGTRQALHEKGRESMTLTLPDVSPRSLGAVIALFERTVGLYASMVGINAYHQPGVEAGKKAAGTVLALHRAALKALRASPGKAFTADELAQTLSAPEQAEVVYHVLTHLAANPADHGVERADGAGPTSRFRSR